MYHVSNNKQLIQIANSIGEGFHQFNADDTVWRGDDGSFVIGDTNSEFDEDEAAMYVEVGKLGDYVTKVD